MNSKFANKVLTSSPVLTNITQDTVDVIEGVYKLKDEKDTTILNTKTLDMMLEKNIVSYDTAKTLYDNQKIRFEGIEEILEKYKNK